jgi:hypothetical protein
MALAAGDSGWSVMKLLRFDAVLQDPLDYIWHFVSSDASLHFKADDLVGLDNQADAHDALAWNAECIE